MSFYLKMALRNVFRQYGRTTLSMVSIVAGVFVLILGRGFVGGTKENIARAQIDSVSGHVQAVPADYPEVLIQAPVDNLLSLPEGVGGWLDEQTQAWTRRTFFVPRAVKGMDSIRVRAIGYHPTRDEAVFPRKDWQVSGSIPSTSKEGLMVSKGVARILELKENDRLVLQVRTVAGAINALEVRVAGVLATGNPMLDRLGVMVPQPLVEELLRPEGRFSHLAIRLAERGKSDAFAANLRDKLGEVARVETWYDEAKDVISTQDRRQSAIDFLAFILMLIAAAGIANTILMAAYERIKEIGTLRAMGMTRGGVLKLFLAEGLVMGVVGTLIGTTLGGLVTNHYGKNGIDLTSMIEDVGQSGAYDNMPFTAMLYMELTPGMLVGAVIFGLLVALLASIYPALIASRMSPAEAVRAE